MTRTTLTTWTLVAIAATALSAAALPAAERAQGPRGGLRPPPPPPPLTLVVERHADELGLGAGTLDRVRDLSEQHRARAEALHDELRQARDDLRALMESDDPDEARAVALVEGLGELQTAAHVERIRSDLAVRELLTPEQFALLRELGPPRPEAGGEGRGFRPPGRPGRPGGRLDGGGDRDGRGGAGGWPSRAD